jgi:hypothetical protein
MPPSRDPDKTAPSNSVRSQAVLHGGPPHRFATQSLKRSVDLPRSHRHLGFHQDVYHRVQKPEFARALRSPAVRALALPRPPASRASAGAAARGRPPPSWSRSRRGPFRKPFGCTCRVRARSYPASWPSVASISDVSRYRSVSVGSSGWKGGKPSRSHHARAREFRAVTTTARHAAFAFSSIAVART